jgi:hypothetical protein
MAPTEVDRTTPFVAFMVVPLRRGVSFASPSPLDPAECCCGCDEDDDDDRPAEEPPTCEERVAGFAEARLRGVRGVKVE